jgi:hypothetical protein
MKNFIVGALIIGGALYYNSEDSPALVPVPPPVFNDGTQVSIIFKSFKVLEENHIGDDWSYEFMIGTSPFGFREKVLDLSNKESLIITCKAIEDDPNHDDIGVTETIITPDNIQHYLGKGEIVELVEVYEQHGKGAGNTAICEFRYMLLSQ